MQCYANVCNGSCCTHLDLRNKVPTRNPAGFRIPQTEGEANLMGNYIRRN